MATFFDGNNEVEIYEGNDPCQQCLGWKRVDDGESQSWKYWAELPKESSIAIKKGWIRAVVCPHCGGTGQEPEENEGDVTV